MNDTNANRRRNLGFFFDDTVRRLPDKVAIIDLFGGRERTSTYRQLDQRMDGVARMLAALGNLDAGPSREHSVRGSSDRGVRIRQNLSASSLSSPPQPRLSHWFMMLATGSSASNTGAACARSSASFCSRAFCWRAFQETASSIATRKFSRRCSRSFKYRSEMSFTPNRGSARGLPPGFLLAGR